MTTVERIIFRLGELQWKQKVLADKTGIATAAISKILSDKDRKLQSKTARKIADALGVTELWLFTGEEPKLISAASAEPVRLQEVFEEVIPRLKAVVMNYMEYIEEKGYKVPPDLIADGICKLYIRSIQEGSLKDEDLRRFISDGRQSDSSLKPEKIDVSKFLQEKLLF